MKQALNRRESGAVLVELAMVLPILVLLLLGVINMGLLIRDYQVLQNAAREGARFSALPTSWVDRRNPRASIEEIKQRVVQYCHEENINVSTGEVSVNQNYLISIGDLTVQASQVTVEYRRSILMPIPGLSLEQVTLSGTSVFRNMY